MEIPKFNKSYTYIDDIVPSNPVINDSYYNITNNMMYRYNGTTFDTLCGAYAMGDLIFTLDNPDSTSTDKFGQSVSITDTYCIVGAPYEPVTGGSNLDKKTYIFNNSTGTLLHTLDNPNPVGTGYNDYFGVSVDITDTYCIVGAPYEDDASGTDSGKSYIFNTVTGALLHTLDNPNAYGTSDNDYFGYSVSITDTFCIVGAYQEDDASGYYSGKSYIFNNSTGALLHTLDNPNPVGTGYNDYFGLSVAITDTYCIVGAMKEDDSSGDESGKAYIFDTVTGTLLHTLDDPNPVGTGAYDRFGVSVSITDTYCIVGAYGEDDVNGDIYSGKAYIFNTETGVLIHTLDNPNPVGDGTDDYFGKSVSITDTHCIVGSNGEDDSSGTDSGKAYIFNTSTGVLLHTLDNPNPVGTSSNDYFGYSVSITDTHCIVGAPYEDDISGAINSGKSYIFSL